MAEDHHGGRANENGVKHARRRVLFRNARRQRIGGSPPFDLSSRGGMRHDNHRGRTAGHGGERWRLSPQSVWAIVKRYARGLREDGVPVADDEMLTPVESAITA